MLHTLSSHSSFKYVMLVFGIILGWVVKGIYLDIQGLTCNDFSTKHTTWQGFMSTKDGQVRCFWLEQAYPWRVRQGVAE